MRTSSIKINGASHLLCFSARVMRACAQRYNGMKNMDQALAGGNEEKILDEYIWLVSEMMNAGDRYAKLEGLDNPKPYTYDQLYDICGTEDIAAIRESITNAISNGTKRNVETEAGKSKGKNALTTPKKEWSGTSGMD